MAGRIKQLLDSIITWRSRGNLAVAETVKTKFVLKGINPDNYTAASPDDPLTIKELETLAKELTELRTQNERLQAEISKRKQVEEELLKNREELEGLLEERTAKLEKAGNMIKRSISRMQDISEE